MATFQTYRDRLTWKIVAYDPNTGTEKYLWPDEYKQKVSSWIVSGKPLDYSLLSQAKTQQPSTATAWSTSSWLEWFNKLQALKEAANKIILMKQNQNKDLTEAWQYWRNIASNPAAFWTKDQSVPSSMQTDESFRLLSPEQQSSIRASRENWARAWIGSVEDERQYREKLSWTALDNVREMYQEENRQTESDRWYNLDKWYKEQTLARANQAEWIWSYYTDNSGNLKPVDKTKVFNIGWVTYDFWASWPSSIYAEDPEWWTLITNMFKSVPKYEEYKDISSRYQTSFDKDIARLAWDNSPLIWMWKYIWEASIQAWVSPELVFSIIRHESANWKSSALKTDNNPWWVTWSSNWPANMKWSKRLEWGNYVKFPTLQAWIDRTIKKIADSVTDWANYVTSWTNTYTDTQLRNVAKNTWYSVEDLKQLSDNDLIQLEIESSKNPIQEFVSTAAWTKIMALYDLTKWELEAAIKTIADPNIPDEMKKNNLNAIYPAWLYDSLQHLKSNLLWL